MTPETPVERRLREIVHREYAARLRERADELSDYAQILGGEAAWNMAQGRRTRARNAGIKAGRAGIDALALYSAADALIARCQDGAS